jgi:hypothetical protein
VKRWDRGKEAIFWNHSAENKWLAHGFARSLRLFFDEYNSSNLRINSLAKYWWNIHGKHGKPPRWKGAEQSKHAAVKVNFQQHEFKGPKTLSMNHGFVTYYPFTKKIKLGSLFHEDSTAWIHDYKERRHFDIQKQV